MAEQGCKHMQFNAHVMVNRLEDTGMFSADVKIHCLECGEPFRFLGLRAGVDYERPTVSMDGLELRAPIQPESVMGKGAIQLKATFRVPPTTARGDES